MNHMPKQPPPPPAYLSEVPSRTSASGGLYKHHRNVGHAKNAILCKGHGWPPKYGPGKIFKWDFDNNEWLLLYTVAPNTPEADLPWKS